jgi:hypothetical protein
LRRERIPGLVHASQAGEVSRRTQAFGLICTAIDVVARLQRAFLLV